AGGQPSDCGSEDAQDRERGGDTPVRPIEEVLADHTAEWMAVPGVVGTGIGTCDGDRCIVIFVREPTPEVVERIPEEIEGHRIRIEETGTVRPRDPGGG
ncbi:MAG TPA: hypothetical protein VM737_08445, partial [Gemmatimonadota bacterium]|nr:hypothetical protein [Gemmatimonadota bacterium]